MIPTHQPINRDPEKGQALIFGALSFFMLLSSISLVVNVAKATEHKMQLQSAADEAALAATNIQANCFSSMAWVSDGMALVYYHLVKYASDTAMLAVAAEMKQHGSPYPSDSVVGISGSVSKYNEARAKAEEWIPKGEDWLRQLGNMQRVMAVASSYMIQEEVFDVATRNGAEYATFYPMNRFWPSSDNYMSVDIKKLDNGWVLDSVEANMTVTATNEGDESWHIEYMDESRELEVHIQKLDEDRFKITQTGDPNTVFYIDRSEDGGFVVQGDDGIEVTNNPDGSTTVCQNGDCSSTRQGPNGLEINNGNGWVPVSGEGGTMNIDGHEVQVSTYVGHIRVGDAIVWPDHIRIGNTSVWFEDPIRIYSHFGPVTVRVENDYARVNGKQTNRSGDTDCEWDRYTSDRNYHRLCTLEEGEHWFYEYKRMEAYLAVGSRYRFATEQAMKDNDPYFNSNKTLPQWTDWFSVETGRASSRFNYHQTRACWNPSDPDRDGIDNNTGFLCPICVDLSGYGGDYDGDGAREVRVALSDTDRAGQEVNTRAFSLPYIVTEDFFKYGITVAVWGRAPNVNLVPNQFSSPSYGTFAIASARAGFWNHEELYGETGKFLYRFETMDDRELWVNEAYANLYEPRWMAKLFPVRDMIRDEDIDADIDADSGLNWLIRGIKDTGYYTSFADYERRRFTPGWDGTHIGRRLDNIHNPHGSGTFNPSDTQNMHKSINH